ncbi:hypothetical protein KFE98_02715 [bacterium SCSIO 12741]|nr:hypothetical protein KFE98_02715 [bacterium SCSIO 12741]
MKFYSIHKSRFQPYILFLLLCTLFMACNDKPMSNKATAAGNLGIQDLSLNDISILWPVPQNAKDVGLLLSANTTIGNTEIWPEDQFNQVVSMARDSLQIPNFPSPPEFKQITFVYGNDSSLLKRENWKVVGFRVDPAAPSTNQAVIDVVGTIPQIRLVVQPVTLQGNQVVVHDFTAHLPFSYTLNGQQPFQPDTAAFKSILDDVVKIKEYVEGMRKLNTDTLLQVNPGLKYKVPGYADKIEAFLNKHLPKGRLELIAFMGLAPRPEPWIFFDMARAPSFQILNTQNTLNMAGPPIQRPNRNWIDNQGVSTAVLYHMNLQLDAPAISGDSLPLNRDIPNIIANPSYCNVLNTDCISCHSESTRRSILNLKGDLNYAFSREPLVQDDLLPTDIYNVRNFGWFGNAGETAKPIISMRTANETANALEYIKSHY